MWLLKLKTNHLPITNTLHVENGYSENHLQSTKWRSTNRLLKQSLNIPEKVKIYFLY